MSYVSNNIALVLYLLLCLALSIPAAGLAQNNQADSGYTSNNSLAEERALEVGPGGDIKRESIEPG